MSFPRILPALVLVVVSAIHAAEAAPPELQGILATGKDHRFALVASGGEHSGWARLGETFDGWRLADYIPAEDAVVLSCEGRQVIVRLKPGVVGEGDAGGGADVRATVAEAEEVLTRMKFDAMWDRIVVEQRKSIVGAMRQQATAEFAKVGLPQEEIDVLLEKMGDVVVAGLQPEVMRQDFARVFSEVYTRDELRGMADFYETAAGKAWAAKQPEVQQKLMQAMMPRVMQGMPAAQKVAAEYMRQRAAKSAAAPTKP